MARFTFEEVKAEADRRNLILERENKIIEGLQYRYIVTDNTIGMEALCTTLSEAWTEIYYWQGKEKFR